VAVVKPPLKVRIGKKHYAVKKETPIGVGGHRDQTNCPCKGKVRLKFDRSTSSTAHGSTLKVRRRCR